MSGQIFISYRRDDSSASAGRLYDRLLVRLPKSQIFIDVDLDPGIDFVEEIEINVSSCAVLVAMIGKRWLLSSDEEGKRRLDNPEDFVRLEIATALKRKIRVMPVLVDGASMPRSSDLPDDLKLLARRNALEVSHNRFNADFDRLVTAIEKVLQQLEPKREARHYHTCFCSYSGADRKEMFTFAQFMRAMGVDLIDALKLRGGDEWNLRIFEIIDKSDIFVLIWSKNARASQYVEKEWRYALMRNKKYGSPDIRPISLQGPAIAPVPRELQAYHFMNLTSFAELETRVPEKKKSERHKPQA
jgi:hypothetical protein